MGDRANFLIRQPNGDMLCIYGHWAGYQMLNRLANALSVVVREGCLTDMWYRNRIMIEHITDHDGNLGWGISINSLADNEHSIPVVDFENGTVSLYDSPLGRYGGGSFNPDSFTNPKFSLSITRFIKKYNHV